MIEPGGPGGNVQVPPPGFHQQLMSSTYPVTCIESGSPEFIQNAASTLLPSPKMSPWIADNHAVVALPTTTQSHAWTPIDIVGLSRRRIGNASQYMTTRTVRRKVAGKNEVARLCLFDDRIMGHALMLAHWFNQVPKKLTARSSV